MQPFMILPLRANKGIALIPSSTFEAFFYSSESSFNDNRTSIMGITITGTTNNRSCVIKCMPHHDDEECILLPEWTCEYLGEETAYINKIDLGFIPVARRIRARVIDNEMYHIDIKETLEEYLSDFKFIQANIVLTVDIDSMGGYPAQIWIEDVIDEDNTSCIGPALLGEEVELDMGEPLERAPEFESLPEPEPEPVPEPVPVPEPEELSSEERSRIAREARLKRFG